jgi:hypothetical protein
VRNMYGNVQYESSEKVFGIGYQNRPAGNRIITSVSANCKKSRQIQQQQHRDYNLSRSSKLPASFCGLQAECRSSVAASGSLMRSKLAECRSSEVASGSLMRPKLAASRCLAACLATRCRSRAITSAVDRGGAADGVLPVSQVFGADFSFSDGGEE